MATLRDSKPPDPMYSEGPQSYSPHWGRTFLASKIPSPKPVDGNPTDPDEKTCKAKASPRSAK